MKKEELLFAVLGKVKDDYIVEASPEPEKREWVSRLKWLPFAAAFVLLFVLMVKFLPSKTTPELLDLPLLTISSENAMGFEAYLAYEAGELENGNPWSRGASISTMPVFKNQARANSAGVPLSGLSVEAMQAQVERMASNLELVPDESYVEYLDDWQTDAAGLGSAPAIRAVAECEGVTIEVEADGLLTLWMDEPVALPQAYVFTGSSSREEADAVLDYLIMEYAGLFDMDFHSKDLFSDYDINGERHLAYRIFQDHGDLEDRIVAYSFKPCEFYPDENGDLWIIRKYSHDLSASLGAYPIITEEQAEDMLLEGHYLTTVAEGLPDDPHVAKFELVYRTGRLEEFFMPYYRFLLELPDMKMENGLKTYGAFYVPAVEQQYLTDMPLWDGGF